MCVTTAFSQQWQVVGLSFVYSPIVTHFIPHAIQTTREGTSCLLYRTCKLDYHSIRIDTDCRLIAVFEVYSLLPLQLVRTPNLHTCLALDIWVHFLLSKYIGIVKNNTLYQIPSRNRDQSASDQCWRESVEWGYYQPNNTTFKLDAPFVTQLESSERPNWSPLDGLAITRIVMRKNQMC